MTCIPLLAICNNKAFLHWNDPRLFRIDRPQKYIDYAEETQVPVLWGYVVEEGKDVPTFTDIKNYIEENTPFKQWVVVQKKNDLHTYFHRLDKLQTRGRCFMETVKKKYGRDAENLFYVDIKKRTLDNPYAKFTMYNSFFHRQFAVDPNITSLDIWKKYPDSLKGSDGGTFFYTIVEFNTFGAKHLGP